MKVRIGFGFGTAAGAGLDAASFWSIVDESERLGWDSIWFSERVHADLPDPIAAMAAVAGRTRRLRFGTSVLVVPGRHPVLLAKELATIDVLSEGRLIVGVGLGAIATEHETLGVERRAAARLTEEAVALVRRLWTEEEVTHEGEHFRTRAVTVLPKPVQRPHPALWFGGHSDAALRRVARLGDGWLPSFVTTAEYKAKVDRVRAVAAQAGREIEDGHFGALVAYLPQWSRADPSPVLRAVAARRQGVPIEDLVVADGVGGLRERIESFVAQGATKFVVVPLAPPREWVEELARLRYSVAQPLET